MCLLSAGCGNVAASSDLCHEYDDFVVAADQLHARDLVDAPMEEVRQLVRVVEADLDHLRATSEGRHDAVITALQSGLDELSHLVADAGVDVRATVQPLIRTSLEIVRDAVNALTRRLAATCD